MSRFHRIAGPNGGTRVPYTQAEEDARDAEEAAALIPIDHKSATNFQIRTAVIGLNKIGVLRTALSSAPDDVIEYWKHKDIFEIADTEVVWVKTALSLSDTALQNLFNSAN